MSATRRYYHVSDTLTDILVGASDGFTIPFIVVAGMTGALLSVNAIIIAGIAAAFIGGIAMGAGAYMGEKEQLDETGELSPREEEILRRIGLGEDIKEQLAAEAAKEKDEFNELAASYELPEDRNALSKIRTSAFTVGIAYLIGGLIPVLPFLLINEQIHALVYAAIFTLVCLFVLSFFRAQRTGRNGLYGALRPVFLTIAAAWGAYYVAGLFV